MKTGSTTRYNGIAVLIYVDSLSKTKKNYFANSYKRHN